MVRADAISMLMSSSINQPVKAGPEADNAGDASAGAGIEREMLDAMSGAQVLTSEDVGNTKRDTVSVVESQTQVDPNVSWACTACTFVNLPRLHGQSDKCKMCDTPRTRKPSAKEDALNWMHKYQVRTRMVLLLSLQTLPLVCFCFRPALYQR